MADPTPNTAARPGPKPSPQTDFGARLLTLRRGLWEESAPRAAKALGISSVSHYYKLERGTQQPSAVLRQLVEVYERLGPLLVLEDAVRRALLRVGARAGRLLPEQLPLIAEAYEVLAEQAEEPAPYIEAAVRARQLHTGAPRKAIK